MNVLLCFGLRVGVLGNSVESIGKEKKIEQYYVSKSINQSCANVQWHIFKWIIQIFELTRNMCCIFKFYVLNIFFVSGQRNIYVELLDDRK